MLMPVGLALNDLLALADNLDVPRQAHNGAGSDEDGDGDGGSPRQKQRRHGKKRLGAESTLQLAAYLASQVSYAAEQLCCPMVLQSCFHKHATTMLYQHPNNPLVYER